MEEGWTSLEESSSGETSEPEENDHQHKELQDKIFPTVEEFLMSEDEMSSTEDAKISPGKKFPSKKLSFFCCCFFFSSYFCEKKNVCFVFSAQENVSVENNVDGPTNCALDVRTPARKKFPSKS